MCIGGGATRDSRRVRSRLDSCWMRAAFGLAQSIYDTLVYIFGSGAIMQVAKCGNSLAVRLPAAVVEALTLKEGDEIEIHVAVARVFEVNPSARRGVSCWHG
jgi:virulence-associated protein VagC